MTATRGTRIALLVAVLWSVVLLVAAFTVRVYSDSATLVEENGSWVGLLMALPLAASVLVTALLLRRHLGRAALVGSWVGVGVLGVVNLLGMLTVGVLLIPVTVSLAIACSLGATTVRSGTA